MEFRRRRGLTQAVAGSWLGVSLFTINRWEGGAQAPPETLLQLSLDRLEQIIPEGE